MKLSWIAVAASLTCSSAHAHDGSDSLSKWFLHLKQPITGMSCCGDHDCRETDYRVKDGAYQAWISTGLVTLGWTTIPENKILRRTPNPTGRAVICWSPMMGIMCFVLPEES